jgi:hypothetical protein
MFRNIRRTIAAAGTALTLGLGGALWATSAASAAPAAVPACSTGSLAVWVNLSAGTVAAGTTAWPLDFTNTGRRSCTLRGYPGAAATNANGGQLGRAADREPNPGATTVTIPAGGTAHAYLLWTEVANFPSGCDVTTASLLKVYPPGQRSAGDAFFSQPVCRSTKPLYQYLFVTAVQPGVGRPL